MPLLTQNHWYHFVRSSTRMLLTFAFHLKTEGHANIPATGPCLLLANHQSYLDPPTIGCSIQRDVYYLARSSLFRSRFFGGFISSINAVPVNQEGPAHEGLRTVITKLQEGKAVLLFPEGTRSADGNMSPIQPGILLILRRVEFSFPIVPVGIAGAYQTWPLHNKRPYVSPLFLPPSSRGPLAVSFGKPVESHTYQGQEKNAILSDIHDRIHAQWQRAELIKPKPPE